MLFNNSKKNGGMLRLVSAVVSAVSNVDNSATDWMNSNKVPSGAVGGLIGACDGAIVEGAFDDGAFEIGAFDDGAFEIGAFDDGAVVEGDFGDGTVVVGAFDDGTFVVGALDDGAFDTGEICGDWDGEILGGVEGARTGADFGTAIGALVTGDSDIGIVGSGGILGAFDITGFLVGGVSGEGTGAFMGCRVDGGMGANGALVFIL